MIEVTLCNIGGRNRCGEEIDAFVILLRLSNKLIPIIITIFIIIITDKFDRLQETEKYPWNFKNK